MAERITTADFEAKVLASDIPVLVDFYSDSCVPCKMLSPVVEQLSNETPDVKFVGVDVDEAERLAVKYGISSIPCLILFENGAEAKRSVGFQPKPALAEFLK